MELNAIINKIREKIDYEISVGIIIGSGLQALADVLDEKVEITYDELDMPKSKVKGHKGSFIFGKLSGKNVMFITRYHFYENGDFEQVKLPYKIARELGVKTIVMTTSTGCLNPNFDVGDIMLIKDHINLTGVNPMINDPEEEVVRFLDFQNIYDKEYLNIVRDIVEKQNVSIREGVHLQVSGPNYETQAEIVFFGKIGGDTVSMSTAHDTIIAVYYDMKVLAFACIVDKIIGENCEELTHDDVLARGNEAAKNIAGIVKEFIAKI